jgi:hypothetical protein
MITVVTGFSPAGFSEYGARFLESFHRHWPRDVRLLVYTEEPMQFVRGECRLIWDIPGCRQFIERYTGDVEKVGLKPNGRWKPKERQAGYSYRFDAVKFCRQGFIPWHAAQLVREGLLCWLDADVVTFRDVPGGFIEGLLPDDCDLAYLGRGAKHSEIGFQLYRLPQAFDMLTEFASMYRDDRIFQLHEWHSAYVFDHVRQACGIRAHDLTPGGRGHVWFDSPLGKYMDHCKGDRKKLGRSPERR